MNKLMRPHSYKDSVSPDAPLAHETAEAKRRTQRRMNPRYLIPALAFVLPQVVPLSIDQGGIPAVKEFYQELGLVNLGVYVDDEMTAPALLRVAGIPGTLLLDRKGREIGRKLGPAEWDSAEMIDEIRGYLNEAEAVGMPMSRGGP